MNARNNLPRADERVNGRKAERRKGRFATSPSFLPLAPSSFLAVCALLIAVPSSAGPRPVPKPKASAKVAPRPSSLVPRPAPLPAISKIELAPAEATLTGRRAAQQFVVTATLPDGTLLDVTDRATFRAISSTIARVSARGVAVPVADGETKVAASVGAHNAPAVVLRVEEMAAPATISFVNDVMPILSKQACNSTVCHGSPVGKGGLKLSLFGYEPDLDHPAMLAKPEAKKLARVDLKNPEKSLLLTKPSMIAAHGGGLRFKKGSAEFNTILAWIKSGAPGLGELEAKVRGIEAFPAERLISKPGATQRLIVTANLSDGTTQDVTRQALYSTNDDSIATVSPDGIVTAKVPGETAIMVRHLGQVSVARIAVLSPQRATTWTNVPTNNAIDTLVYEKLKRLGVVPSALCTDEEFVRRAYLDTTGAVPTVDEARSFLRDKDPKKRSKLIDALLKRPEFVDVWTLKWNDTLRNNPRLTRTGLAAYHKWIREQVEKNVPFDQMVRDLLTAQGKQDEQGAVNYFMVSRDPLDLTSATSQIFMGVRIECARCHNHPFEKYTQSDYYGLAAFFQNVRRQGNGNQAPAMVTVSQTLPGPRGRRLQGPQLRHPKTNQPVEPKVLDAVEIKLDTTDPRITFAEWLTSPNNPFFARSISNRIWAHYMGKGIVDPVDDFRATNPASNPALLDALAKSLVDHKFDVKELMRDIMNSRVYQTSAKANASNKTDTRNFARAYPKRLTAEQLFDSITLATDSVTLLTPQRRPGAGNGNVMQQVLADAMDPTATRAHQIAIPRLPGPVGAFLDTFGKPRREVVCECERSSDGSVGQALTLINGDLLNVKIAMPRGRVQRLARTMRPETETIEEMYLATLTRQPTSAEYTEAQALIRSAPSLQQGLEDLMWGLLNTREFLFNH